MFHNALFINNGLINNVLLPEDEKNFYNLYDKGMCIFGSHFENENIVVSFE